MSGFGGHCYVWAAPIHNSLAASFQTNSIVIAEILADRSHRIAKSSPRCLIKDHCVVAHPHVDKVLAMVEGRAAELQVYDCSLALLVAERLLKEYGRCHIALQLGSEFQGKRS